MRLKTIQSKTYTTPRRPFEKERLDQELKLIGEYGLRNKREVWRVKYTLGKIRAAARELLTLEEKDQRRLFEGKILSNLLFLLDGLSLSDDSCFSLHSFGKVARVLIFTLITGS